MAIEKIDLDTFLHLRQSLMVFDVRSPGEFAHAHVPGAVSFPIFNDAERSEIGTAYKQVSRESAIKIGLQAFGKNLLSMVEQAVQLLRGHAEPRTVIVHCWRGGMRSAAVAWLLDLYGFKVYLLNGGYKVFRKWALAQFEKRYDLKILGGYTGSNKTGVIQLLRSEGLPCIDLEGLANHKGSAFGNLDLLPQPSQEYFENCLACELLEASHKGKHIVLEGESQRIGTVNIPPAFFAEMRRAELYFLDVPFEARLQHIVEGYGTYTKEQLINAIVRIKKRLGGVEAKACVNALIEDDVLSCFRILLQYYDKQYLKQTLGKEAPQRPVKMIQAVTVDAKLNLQLLLNDAEL